MRREGGQVRAAEAGRRGSVGHVEVFRMDGVGTSIVGRPRRLSADRRARPTYTLIWEEPLTAVSRQPQMRVKGYRNKCHRPNIFVPRRRSAASIWAVGRAYAAS
jgi:hypothetical protein